MTRLCFYVRIMLIKGLPGQREAGTDFIKHGRCFETAKAFADAGTKAMNVFQRSI